MSGYDEFLADVRRRVERRRRMGTLPNTDTYMASIQAALQRLGPRRNDQAVRAVLMVADSELWELVDFAESVDREQGTNDDPDPLDTAEAEENDARVGSLEDRGFPYAGGYGEGQS